MQGRRTIYHSALQVNDTCEFLAKRYGCEGFTLVHELGDPVSNILWQPTELCGSISVNDRITHENQPNPRVFASRTTVSTLGFLKLGALLGCFIMAVKVICFVFPFPLALDAGPEEGAESRSIETLSPF
jgi:hypothetical protein